MLKPWCSLVYNKAAVRTDTLHSLGGGRDRVFDSQHLQTDTYFTN